MKYLKVAPVHLEEDIEKLTPSVTVPNVKGKTVAEAEKALKEAGFTVLVKGKGKVVSQIPAASGLAVKGAAVMVTGDEDVDAYTDIWQD